MIHFFLSWLSYLTTVSIEHSLNTTTKGLLSVMILENSKRKWPLKKYSPVSFLFDLCHSIQHKVLFRPDISSHITWNSKVKIWVWERLVKRADLSVSTSQSSSHMSQCLRNNWMAKGRHTLVHLAAQIPLSMFKTPPIVTLTGAWNKLKHHLGDCCHDIWHSWYTPTGLHH